jgi:hypothetical protein
VNAQDEPAANKDVAWLFQPGLTVTAPGTTAGITEGAAFCPIDDPLEDTAGPRYDDPEDRQLRLLYRVAWHARTSDG